MDEAKVIYWGLVAAMAVLVPAGLWLSLFGDRILEKRAKLAEARLGKKGVAFFVGTLRVLAMTVAVLALYLLVNLLRIMPCALK
jgi:hypothetical protein